MLTDCPFGAGYYNVTNTVTLVSHSSAPNVTAATTVSLLCPQPVFSGESANAKLIQEWAWDADLAVNSPTPDNATWQLVGG